MAESLRRFPENRLSIFVQLKKLAYGVFLCAAGVISSLATAASLPDPTRPPAALYAVGENTGDDAPSAPALQSVLIGPGRRVAVINGQTVKVGDTVGDAQLVKISEGEVMLRSGKELRILKLFPELEKRRVSIAPETKQVHR